MLKESYTLNKYDCFFYVIDKLKEINKRYLLDLINKFYIPITDTEKTDTGIKTNTTFKISDDVDKKIINILWLAYCDTNITNILKDELLMTSLIGSINLGKLIDLNDRYSIDEIQKAKNELEKELSEYVNKNEKDDLALIMLNVENFHLINKIFSCQKGDQILKEIASILAQISDNNKIAAHLCADHFAVILKNQSLLEIEETLNFIKKEVAKLNIKGIYIDVDAVFLEKTNDKISARDFFNDGVAKINLKRYKTSKESNFYCSLVNYIKKDNYKKLRQNNQLIELTRETADFFELSKQEKKKMMLLAGHHDLGKLALDKNILKKGEKFTAKEWHEYQKHVLISANFVSYYHDLAEITNLVLAHHEHFDGTGWPKGLKGEEIPYLSRLFAVINFYSNLNSNLYFPLLQNKYYFGALEDREIIKELKYYQGKLFDPQIVDKFILFLKDLD